MILCRSFSATFFDKTQQPIDFNMYSIKNTLFKSFSATVFDVTVGQGASQILSTKNTIFKSFGASLGVVGDSVQYPYNWVGELVEAPSLTPTPPIVAVAPVTNWIYRNSVDTLTYIYNGTAWVLLDETNKPKTYIFPMNYVETGNILRKK